MQAQTTFEDMFSERVNLSLRPEKSLAYDLDTAMFHLPTEWIKGSEIAPGVSPTVTELRDAAISAIKGEFGNPSNRGKWQGFPHMELGTHRRIEDIVWKYLKICEASIYSGAYDDLVYAKNKTESERFRLLLCDQQVGRKQNARWLNESDFDARIMDRMARKEPIQIVLPSFPFKDQNPFRNDLPAHSVDLGEIAMLVRLHSTALALYQIYAFGVQWVIVCDGIVYSKLFGVDTADAAEYREELRRWRNRLNLQQTIQIIDFEDIIAKLSFPQTANSTFWTQCDQVVKTLRDLCEDDGESLLKEALLTLKRGMKWNLNTRDYLASGQLSAEHLWQILNGYNTEGLTNSACRILEDIDHRAEVAAFGYLAFNLQMGRYSRGIEATLPRAIRATVHPKPGQILAPSPGGDVFPWNGRCLVTQEEAVTVDSILCKPLYKFAQDGYSSVTCRGVGAQNECFYFLTQT